MTEWDKTKLARSYNKDTKKYDEVIEAIIAARPVGKGVVTMNGKMYEIDNNFRPPRVAEIEEEA